MGKLLRREPTKTGCARSNTCVKPVLRCAAAALLGWANRTMIASGFFTNSLHWILILRASPLTCSLESKEHPWATRSLWTRLFLSEPSRQLESRSEEHTSELQSLRHLVCRLLLEKKNRRNRSRQFGHLVV